MHDALAPALLHAASVLLLAVAAEDGNVDPREVQRAAEAIAAWGRTDRVTASRVVQASFQELGEVWNLGGHAELDRHVWTHADVLVAHLDWHALHALAECLVEVAGADGHLDRAEEGLVEALASHFDREAGPPETMTALELLQGFDADSRGARWTERFHARIGEATLDVGGPADPTPAVVRGPGGTHLAHARLVPRGGARVSFWELARWCTNQGVGLHVEPDWHDPPGHVFRLGELWSFRAFDGSLSGPRFDREPLPDELLPHWARELLARLFEAHGLPGRQVALLTSPAGEPTLAFDAPAHYLPTVDAHEALERDLRWTAPPGVVFLTVDPAQHPELGWTPL